VIPGVLVVVDEQLLRVTIFPPPGRGRLVGRPAQEDMAVAYARLCLPYVGAVCLRRGNVGLRDFTAQALADRDTLALARRLAAAANDNPDPNALHPVRVEIDLVDGRTLDCDVAEVLGSPARPLSPDAARAKFVACGAPAALWDIVMVLETLEDAATLARGAAYSWSQR